MNRPPLLHPVWLLPVLASAALAADGEPEVVTVKDFLLTPMANLGAADGTWELHPKALVGGGYDDNLYLNDADNGQEGGWYARGVAGVDLRWLPNDTDRVVLDGEVERSIYRDHPDRDFTGVNGLLSGRREGALFALSGKAGYRRTQDPLVQTRTIVPRDLWNLLGQGDYKGLIDTWSLGVRHDGVRYREGFSTYGADEASYARTGIFARYGYQFAEEDELYVRVGTDANRYREDGAFNDSVGIDGVVGVRRGLAAKTDALLEAGVAWRRYEDYFHQPDPIDPTIMRSGDSRIALGPLVQAELRYSWEELSAVALRGFSEIADSLTTNAAWYVGGGVDVRQRLLGNCAALAGMQAYRFRDLDTIEGLEPESRTTVGFNAGIEFFLRDGVGLRLMGTYEDSHARVSESYDRFTVFTDLAVVF